MVNILPTDLQVRSGADFVWSFLILPIDLQVIPHTIAKQREPGGRRERHQQAQPGGGVQGGQGPFQDGRERHSAPGEGSLSGVLLVCWQNGCRPDITIQVDWV